MLLFHSFIGGPESTSFLTVEAFLRSFLHLLSGIPRSSWLPSCISKIPLDQKQYIVLVPLVGEYFVHQPFIVFGITKVIICLDFPLGEDLVIVLIEWPQTAYMERRMNPLCLQ